MNEAAADQWDSYLSLVNDEPASIFLNLSLKAQAPFPGRPIVVWLFVEMKNPRPDGLPSAEEFDSLKQIENEIERKLEEVQGLYVGRISGQGRREYYIYVPEQANLEAWASAVMKAFPSYAFESGSQPDPESSQYLEVLYPAPMAMQQIHNRNILDALKSRGDSHEIPRQVDHFANFEQEVERAAFVQWARSQGFEVQVSSQADRELPWSAALSKVHAVDRSSIESITFDLIEQIESHGGQYDGWGCPVVQPTKPRSLLGRLFQKGG